MRVLLAFGAEFYTDPTEKAEALVEPTSRLVTFLNYKHKLKT